MQQMVNTVNGPVSVDTLGYILPHEHVVTFPSDQDRATYQETRDHFIPIYRELVKKYGCNTLVDLSPKRVANTANTCRLPDGYRRSNLGLIKDISRESGMNIVTCTGFYREHTRPEYFSHWECNRLADEMIRDITCGIEDSGVKAGIIKIAIDNMTSESDRKLLKAAALAQKETGVAITTHTCSPEVRAGVLNYLEGAGVNPSRIYLGHADANGDICESLILLSRGCNLLYTIWGITNPSLIGWNKGRVPKYYSSYLVKAAVDEGYAGQILMSIDYSSWFMDGKFRHDLYEIADRTPLYLFTFAVPAMAETGIAQTDIDRIMAENPGRMLSSGLN